MIGIEIESMQKITNYKSGTIFVFFFNLVVYFYKQLNFQMKPKRYLL